MAWQDMHPVKSGERGYAKSGLDAEVIRKWWARSGVSMESLDARRESDELARIIEALSKGQSQIETSHFRMGQSRVTIPHIRSPLWWDGVVVGFWLLVYFGGVVLIIRRSSASLKEVVRVP